MERYRQLELNTNQIGLGIRVLLCFFPISNPGIRWRNMAMSVDKTTLQKDNQDAAQKELDNLKNLNKRRNSITEDSTTFLP